jgi:predicted transcriptional regulator
MPQTSIRLSDELWQALSEASTRTGQSRTALIQQAIEQFLGVATARQSDAAIGDILTRLDRLEATVFASRPEPKRNPVASRLQTDCIPTGIQAQPGQTFTTRELADRLGIDRSNASRDLKKRGFERIGNAGKMGLWAQVKPPKNEI